MFKICSVLVIIPSIVLPLNGFERGTKYFVEKLKFFKFHLIKVFRDVCRIHDTERIYSYSIFSFLNCPLRYNHKTSIDTRTFNTSQMNDVDWGVAIRLRYGCLNLR